MIVSIITPCLNRAGFVAEAVESVQQQDYPSVEHIIMDGGSTDGTLALLEGYSHLRVYSQPDNGIYDAINKGVRQSQGEVIGFLNTDDLYEPDIFAAVAQTFVAYPEIDALVGGASIFYEESEDQPVTLASFPGIPQGELLARATQGAPVFNAWFFRKRLFDQLGEFDLGYLYVADRDFLIRMAFQGTSYATLNRPFYRYRMHPGSYTLSGYDSGEEPFMFECRALAERYIHSNVSPEALQCFKAWHSQIVNEQILTAYRKRAFPRAFGYMLAGLRHNVRWPMLFLEKFIERLSVFLKEKLKPSSSLAFQHTNQDKYPPAG